MIIYLIIKGIRKEYDLDWEVREGFFEGLIVE